MKKRLVAGLLAAGLSTAVFAFPAEAHCDSGSCSALSPKHTKKFSRVRVVSNVITTAKGTKVRITRFSRTRPISNKIAPTRELTPKSHKTRIATTISVRYVFRAPIRRQTALALHVPAPLKSTANGSVVSMIKSMAPQYGVPTWFALRIAKVESNYNPNARGTHGELGVFQMKCATAKGIGYRGNCAGLLNARTGVQYGLKHLSIALKSSGGNLKLAASKHNGGLGCKRLVPRYVAMVF